jgi:two-component system, OmpR family, response regulator MprA
MHLLLVEDDPRLQRVLRRLLEDDRHIVEVASDGESALEVAEATTGIETVILDVGLPDMSGLDVAKSLRRGGRELTILMLTARDTVNDRVAGLDAGADDYLAKPFDTEELIARVKALLRRATLRADDAKLRLGELVLDPITRQVRRGDRDIALTQREFALLEYLVRNAGREVTRDQITEHVWGQDAEPSTNVVDVYVNYLRKKLDADGLPQLLHTVRGVGYVLRG